MAFMASRPKKTIDDFRALGNGVLAELIDGEIYVTPSPSRRHQDVVRHVAWLLDAFVRASNLGHMYFAPLDVHLPSGDIVEPDLIFVGRDNEDILQRWIHGTPDLLIEVVSPSHPERDRIVKRDLYAANGVSEYWIVDLDAQAVEVLSLAEGAYQPAGFFTAGMTLRSPLLCDFKMSIDEVFA